MLNSAPGSGGELHGGHVDNKSQIAHHSKRDILGETGLYSPFDESAPAAASGHDNHDHSANSSHAAGSQMEPSRQVGLSLVIGFVVMLVVEHLQRAMHTGLQRNHTNRLLPSDW
jgi:hypothetical protein